MANKKITELDAITTLASTDVVPVVDVSADTTNKITASNLFRTLPDGTAAAPSLSFASDAGNGVFLAGTDTVGISTGGTQRVTVDGSGNVTISGDLTVSGATTTVESTTVTIDDKNIELGSVAHWLRQFMCSLTKPCVRSPQHRRFRCTTLKYSTFCIIIVMLPSSQ